MSKKLPIVYGALLLTGVNLLLRLAGTSFELYLSHVMGAAGMGLLHLIGSVCGFALTAGNAGVRTAAMYLTAEELGRKKSIRPLISGCFGYGLICSGILAGLLFGAAPALSQFWIGSMDALESLRIYAAFLPIQCLCGILTGYFIAANRIGMLSVIQVADQLMSIGITALILLTVSDADPGNICAAVIWGQCGGAVFSVSVLAFSYFRGTAAERPGLPAGKRVFATALPFALGDDLKTGISAIENLMVPRRLGRFPAISSPLAAFGLTAGVVFPIMMFPAAILYALVELLIPELARCRAAGSKNRIRYLMERNLRVTLLYGLICGAGIFLLSDSLSRWIYPHYQVARFLRMYAWLIPMLYTDIVVDGLTKGLGQQKACIRYNIVSNSLDVIFLFFLLPKFGMDGYFVSFAITHTLNFLLSFHRLQIIEPMHRDWSSVFSAYVCCIASGFFSLFFDGPTRKICAFLGLFFCSCMLLGVITPEDIQWFKNLPKQKGNLPSHS